MTALARFLRNGHLPTTVSEGVHEDVDIQAIYMEFVDADEDNLLDEEDMHVFGSMPLADPLQLVSCNACRRTIMASQYAAHTEHCSSLENTVLDLASGSALKKSPRKGSRAVQGTDDNVSIAAEHEKPESDKGNDIAPKLNIDDKSNTLLTQLVEPQNIIGQDLDENYGWRSTRGKDLPVPLATKVYNCQGTSRLRLALAHIYHGALGKGHTHDPRSPEVTQEGNMVSSQVSSSSKYFHGLHSTVVPQKILAQGPELCMEASPVSSVVGFSNQLREKNFAGPRMQVTASPVGMMNSRYHSTPYGYSANTGANLGSMQPVNQDLGCRATSMG